MLHLVEENSLYVKPKDEIAWLSIHHSIKHVYFPKEKLYIRCTINILQLVIYTAKKAVLLCK